MRNSAMVLIECFHIRPGANLFNGRVIENTSEPQNQFLASNTVR